MVRGPLCRHGRPIADCGFDGVEIHTGADHLFDTFLSRFWNRRDDEYGAQNWENRTRFVREVIEAVRKRCGDRTSPSRSSSTGSSSASAIWA